MHCHDQYPNVFIYFFFQFVFNICFFKLVLFVDQMTQNLFMLARINQQVAELKQIMFFSNDNIALDFYCLKAGKHNNREYGWELFGITV